MVWVVVVVNTWVVVVVSATIKGAGGSLYGGGRSCEFPREKRPTIKCGGWGIETAVDFCSLGHTRDRVPNQVIKFP